jgi:hypothetical protein
MEITKNLRISGLWAEILIPGPPEYEAGVTTMFVRDCVKIHGLIIILRHNCSPQRLGHVHLVLVVMTLVFNPLMETTAGARLAYKEGDGSYVPHK